MPSPLLEKALTALDSWPAEVTVMKDGQYGNCCWLIETPKREPFVLRRYHDGATREDLEYEHAVLRHLSSEGWVVPEPTGELIHLDGWWWVPTRLVPGMVVTDESVDQRRRRGRDLARLHRSLRGLSHMGQRPGWRSQHEAVTVHTTLDWDGCLRLFATAHPELAAWAAEAADVAHRKLEAVGAADLPTLVVHGDFHELNVHYDESRLAGVLDLGLTHVDSRPYELAIARTHRSPEVIDAFRQESAKGGWPLSELEEECLLPMRAAFRVDMVAWQLDHGRRVGVYDTRMVESQLSKSGVPRP